MFYSWSLSAWLGSILTHPSHPLLEIINAHTICFPPLHIMGHSLGKPKLLTAKFKLMPRLFCHCLQCINAMHYSCKGTLKHTYVCFSWLNDSWGGLDGDHHHYGWGSISHQSSSASFVHSLGLNSSNPGGSSTIECCNECVCVSGQLKDHTQGTADLSVFIFPLNLILQMYFLPYLKG